MITKHTPGPWRWEINQESKYLRLVGGKPQFDRTILRPVRWGMGSATLFVRDTAHDGMNIMHKLHERADWVVPFPGRAHHASWCSGVKHPDLQLIEAAPDLLEVLMWFMPFIESEQGDDRQAPWVKKARAALAKAGVGHGMSTPEALRLADHLDNDEYYLSAKHIGEAAAELRRQHAEIERLTAALDKARTEARVAYLAFEQVKASRAKLRQAIAALLDDDDHDTAKELARAALKGDKP